MVKPRRTTSTVPRTHQQATLSFKTSSKVTKAGTPSAVADAKKATISPPVLRKVSQEFTKPASNASSVAASPVSVKSFESEISAKSVERELTNEEIEARAVSEKEIRDYYYKEILGPRKVAPVHQDDLSETEKFLRHFDMASEFGPFVGISRLDRWKRAHDLGLEPALEILAVILKVEDNLGKSEDKNRDERIAYIDDFLRGGGDPTA